MNVYKGHDPSLGDAGTDVLVTKHDDGSLEVALRPGMDQTWLAWGPPTQLAGDKSGRCSCGMAGCSDAAVTR